MSLSKDMYQTPATFRQTNDPQTSTMSQDIAVPQRPGVSQHQIMLQSSATAPVPAIGQNQAMAQYEAPSMSATARLPVRSHQEVPSLAQTSTTAQLPMMGQDQDMARNGVSAMALLTDGPQTQVAAPATVGRKKTKISSAKSKWAKTPKEDWENDSSLTAKGRRCMQNRLSARKHREMKQVYGLLAELEAVYKAHPSPENLARRDAQIQAAEDWENLYAPNYSRRNRRIRQTRRSPNIPQSATQQPVPLSVPDFNAPITPTQASSDATLLQQAHGLTGNSPSQQIQGLTGNALPQQTQQLPGSSLSQQTQQMTGSSLPQQPQGISSHTVPQQTQGTVGSGFQHRTQESTGYGLPQQTQWPTNPRSEMQHVHHHCKKHPCKNNNRQPHVPTPVITNSNVWNTGNTFQRQAQRPQITNSMVNGVIIQKNGYAIQHQTQAAQIAGLMSNGFHAPNVSYVIQRQSQRPQTAGPIMNGTYASNIGYTIQRQTPRSRTAGPMFSGTHAPNMDYTIQQQAPLLQAARCISTGTHAPNVGLRFGQQPQLLQAADPVLTYNRVSETEHTTVVRQTESQQVAASTTDDIYIPNTTFTGASEGLFDTDMSRLFDFDLASDSPIAMESTEAAELTEVTELTDATETQLPHVAVSTTVDTHVPEAVAATARNEPIIWDMNFDFDSYLAAELSEAPESAEVAALPELVEDLVKDLDEDLGDSEILPETDDNTSQEQIENTFDDLAPLVAGEMSLSLDVGAQSPPNLDWLLEEGSTTLNEASHTLPK